MARYMPDGSEGDTLIVSVIIRNAETQLPADPTGWRIWLTLKRRYSDSDADAVLQLTSVGGEGPYDDIPTGRLTCAGFWPKAGLYVYDLQVRRPDGTIETIIPPLENNDADQKWRDRVRVIPRVTEASA